MTSCVAKQRLQDQLDNGTITFEGRMKLALINERNGCTPKEIAARHPDVSENQVRAWESTEKHLNQDLLIAASKVYKRHWTKPAFVAAGVKFDDEAFSMIDNMLLDMRKSFFWKVKDPMGYTSPNTENRFQKELRNSRPAIEKFSKTKTWEDYVNIFDFKGRRKR